MEKFEYQLKGRYFQLITDHKALEFIRKKEGFENSRMQRWLEKMQEYDFTVEYRRGESIISADALSRIYEDEIKEKDEIRIGKYKDKTFMQGGTTFIRLNKDEVRMIPKIDERKKLVKETHEKLIHCGIETVYYELEREYLWQGTRETIKNVIKRCEICSVNNRKLNGGFEFVETKNPLEIVGIDIMNVGEHGKKSIDSNRLFYKESVDESIESKNITRDIRKT